MAKKAKKTPAASKKQKQPSRFLKVTCPKSGYICRTTRKWITLYGCPLSPVTGKAMKEA